MVDGKGWALRETRGVGKVCTDSAAMWSTLHVLSIRLLAAMTLPRVLEMTYYVNEARGVMLEDGTAGELQDLGHAIVYDCR